jgi:hypothetical protein
MEYDINHNGAGKVVGVSVAKLRNVLDGLPDDALVVLAKDPEGNGYSPLSAFSGGAGDDQVLYTAETTYSGEIHHVADEAEADGWGCEAPDPADDNVIDCVVLWPIN